MRCVGVQLSGFSRVSVLAAELAAAPPPPRRARARARHSRATRPTPRARVSEPGVQVPGAVDDPVRLRAGGLGVDPGLELGDKAVDAEVGVVPGGEPGHRAASSRASGLGSSGTGAAQETASPPPVVPPARASPPASGRAPHRSHLGAGFGAPTWDEDAWAEPGDPSGRSASKAASRSAGTSRAGSAPGGSGARTRWTACQNASWRTSDCQRMEPPEPLLRASATSCSRCHRTSASTSCDSHPGATAASAGRRSRSAPRLRVASVVASAGPWMESARERERGGGGWGRVSEEGGARNFGQSRAGSRSDAAHRVEYRHHARGVPMQKRLGEVHGALPPEMQPSAATLAARARPHCGRGRIILADEKASRRRLAVTAPAPEIRRTRGHPA